MKYFNPLIAYELCFFAVAQIRCSLGEHGDHRYAAKIFISFEMNTKRLQEAEKMMKIYFTEMINSPRGRGNHVKGVVY